LKDAARCTARVRASTLPVFVAKVIGGPTFLVGSGRGDRRWQWRRRPESCRIVLRQVRHASISPSVSRSSF
jgi:hypothetical protein